MNSSYGQCGCGGNVESYGRISPGYGGYSDDIVDADMAQLAANGIQVKRRNRGLSAGEIAALLDGVGAASAGVGSLVHGGGGRGSYVPVDAGPPSGGAIPGQSAGMSPGMMLLAGGAVVMTGLLAVAAMSSGKRSRR